MTTQRDNTDQGMDGAQSAFDDLIASGAQQGDSPSFTTSFRGYEKHEVDEAISVLSLRLQEREASIESLKSRLQRGEKAASARNRELTQARQSLERLETDLRQVRAQAAEAEQLVQALSEELVSATSEQTENRQQFDELLRVGEAQASVLIKNATVQTERLLEAAREEIAIRRREAEAQAEAIRSQAESEAQQVRLRIETELTAHTSMIERERSRSAEMVSQAEQEAAVIRTEAERGAAALRALASRETAQDRADAESAIREMRERVLEFEETLTRRQDDAQQEFLVLHNQAVAHAERITQDANEQVAASLEHAQRISAKAEDYERLARAQAAQIEADANVRANEQLDRARDKAQRIIDMVTTHSTGILRDAEDRTRQLRWQQHEMTSFMAGIKELIRGEVPLDSEDHDDKDHGDEDRGDDVEGVTADGVDASEPEPELESEPPVEAASEMSAQKS
jgi:hypothetical protein